MNISEIRIKLMPNTGHNRLKAYCSITFDQSFVVRDLKIIEGGKGLFVAMPSRKLSDKCPSCSQKNHLRAAFCNNCGGRLDPNRASTDERGRARLHADLAHPINPGCRLELHRAILAALDEEMERAKSSGYVAPSFDEFDDLSDAVDEEYLTALVHRSEPQPPPEAEREAGA